MHKVSTTHGTLSILDHGSGRPILFIHGFPLDHTMWTAQVEAFEQTHRVIVPDLRGFGESSVASDVMSMARFADDLQECLSQRGVNSPVTVCGLSMGGYIAFELFRRWRPLVERLILCDTRAAADSEAARKVRYETAERVLQEGGDFLAEAMLEKLFSPKTLAKKKEIVEQTRQVIRQTSPEGIAAALKGMAIREDATPRLSEIEVPTLLIVGSDDAITPPAEMKLMEQQIPDARLCVVADAGHLAPLENPNIVNQSIREWLDD